MFVLLIIFFALATAVRLYVFEPVKLMDSSMAPKFREGSIVWMCKLPHCITNLQDQDVVWVKLRSDETQVRHILSMPGDSIEISDKGKVYSTHRNFKWKGENAFIQSRKMYIPKAGDTLIFDRLNDVEQDYAISYLREKGENIFLKTTLWQGDHEMPIDRIGATKIANRQVSLNEIDFLPWQDRYLIEEQIRQSEPGNAPIKIRRELFRSARTYKDSLEIVSSQKIDSIFIDDDCFYLICEKSSSCPDSRELGYFTKDKLIGRHVEWPDKIKESFWIPAKTFAVKLIPKPKKKQPAAESKSENAE